jgi:hypothetical protein
MKCKHCGYIPPNDTIKHCNNIGCKWYGKRIDVDVDVDVAVAFAEQKHQENSCGMLGFATVPDQIFGRTYDMETAMAKGTVFPELDMPYTKRILNRGGQG